MKDTPIELSPTRFAATSTRLLAGEGVLGGEGLEFSGEDALVNRVWRLPRAPDNASFLLVAFLAAGERIGRKTFETGIAKADEVPE